MCEGGSDREDSANQHQNDRDDPKDARPEQGSGHQRNTEQERGPTLRKLNREGRVLGRGQRSDPNDSSDREDDTGDNGERLSLKRVRGLRVNRTCLLRTVADDLHVTTSLQTRYAH